MYTGSDGLENPSEATFERGRAPSLCHDSFAAVFPRVSSFTESPAQLTADRPPRSRVAHARRRPRNQRSPANPRRNSQNNQRKNVSSSQADGAPGQAARQHRPTQNARPRCARSAAPRSVGGRARGRCRKRSKKIKETQESRGETSAEIKEKMSANVGEFQAGCAHEIKEDP